METTELQLFIHTLRGVDIYARHISASECMIRAARLNVYRFTARDAYGVTFGYMTVPRTFMGVRIKWNFDLSWPWKIESEADFNTLLFA